MKLSHRPGQERAKVPALGQSSESQAQPGRSPHGVANARENGHKHRKRGRLQQQTQTGGGGDEARGQQWGECRHKKAVVKLMAGGPSKINPPNSHPSNPVHQMKPPCG